jgi:hypothetical protein
MKPGLSPEMLKMARTALGMLAACALLVIGNDKAMTALGLLEYRGLLGQIVALLAGKELLPRLGDVSPSKHELEVVKAATLRPPPIIINSNEPPQ